MSGSVAAFAQAAEEVASAVVGALQRGREEWLPVAKIVHADDFVREPGVVEDIAASFVATSHQASSIVVRPDPLLHTVGEAALRQDRFRVVAGDHRLEAARLAGWHEIRAIVLPFETEADGLVADLLHIDENLRRKRLTPATEALLTARRKTLYERLHPGTAHGSPTVSRQVGDTRERSDAPRFSVSQASVTGRSERSVQRAATRGETLGPDVLSRVKGTALDKGEELDALARMAPEVRSAVVDRAAAGERVSAKVEAKKAHRVQREAALAQRQAALPDKRYGVILCDPAWKHRPWGETGMDRAADNHYPTMETDAISGLSVGSIAAPDCVLLMWAVVPMLPEALRVMEAWGFRYASSAVWVKRRPGQGIGLGYWFRIDHELLLLGTRGQVPAPAPGTQWRSVLEHPARIHSAKPEAVHEMIEAYFPSLPKIELNRRGPARPGWDAWGNEALPAHDPETGELVDGDPDVDPATAETFE